MHSYSVYQLHEICKPVIINGLTDPNKLLVTGYTVYFASGNGLSVDFVRHVTYCKYMGYNIIKIYGTLWHAGCNREGQRSK